MRTEMFSVLWLLLAGNAGCCDFHMGDSQVIAKVSCDLSSTGIIKTAKLGPEKGYQLKLTIKHPGTMEKLQNRGRRISNSVLGHKTYSSKDYSGKFIHYQVQIFVQN